MKNKLLCIVCKKELSGKQTHFCTIACKNKAHNSYDNQKLRGLERKYFLVKSFGGKCANCGYSKNLAALAFHHLSNKEFKLDMRNLSSKVQGIILDEAKKCKLLCHNCHAEVHNPNFNLANLSIEPTALTTELRALNKP